jgi:LmbE family N-acetylglucosaminyl deacetylase
MGGSPRILGFFAHPDDESFCAGGTFAKYAAAGAESLVVSATRGQAGQINDASAATRRTIGEVRERELLLACERLGVQQARCLDYMDGALQDVDRQTLAEDVTDALREFGPDVVITFGEDGAYGHPDHIAANVATVAACRAWRDAGKAGPNFRLYESHFPRSRHLMSDRLSRWLVQMKKHFTGTADFIRALSLFAQESSTMGYASDVVDVQWSPPGSYIIEKGERSTSLYLILSGEAEVVDEDATGRSRTVARVGPGEFFGELGLAYGRPRADNVVAVDSVTCLVFSPGEHSLFAGRGAGAELVETVQDQEEGDHAAGGATTCIDATDFVDQKIAAIGAHRTQFPIEPGMFPRPMLQEMLGKEYFVRLIPPVEPETELLPPDT